jgi:hypothetical protein
VEKRVDVQKAAAKPWKGSQKAGCVGRCETSRNEPAKIKRKM